MELSDLEKEKIIAFNADPILVEAVRKVLLAAIYTNGTLRKDHPSEPLRNAALSLVAITNQVPITDEQLGQDLRGLWAGLNALEGGLRELARIKKETGDENTPENEAI